MSFAFAALLAAQAAAAPAPVDYGKPANWLCLPGRKDLCTTPLPTTALNPNGYGSTGLSPVAANSEVDCFVVYPTVSRDSGLNSDLVPGDGEEKASIASQFARFAGSCRMFAPVYRSMTLGAVAYAAAGGDMTVPAMTAYRDVRDAFRNYLARYNKGRPYVLIGHSQGSLMLQQLIANEIEGKPAAKLMKLAILPGYNLLVPQGKRVGGTLKSTPICSSPGETGCVMTWVSFREKNVPPAGAIFGVSDKPGMTVACTNPALPGATGWVSLDSYWNARSALPVPGGPIRWSTEGNPPTPYVRTEGLASARCVNEGPRGYLSIRTNADPSDKRTDRIGGEVGLAGMFIPGWGMHLADVSVAQGDLVRRVSDLNGQVSQGQGRAR
ncbi:DUF3089 domain-containing protein [Sphingomonas sp. HDW15A]|uniref:DUF3089 domain-containing protein n=1 Tax=Sphingomonas sp. HDW15A TaxID=2714942 RepID=UPI0014086FF2|nr:DUF3089 domain-containing protein [Sphingomonas sp. HDW15A]QIK95218.1 DUF3089 domain-containing protein [Sphingomonas sp. HDW15A]